MPGPFTDTHVDGGPDVMAGATPTMQPLPAIAVTNSGRIEHDSSTASSYGPLPLNWGLGP